MKKGLVVILAGVLAVAMGLGGLSFVNNIRNTRSFIADGYILDPSDEETVTTNVDAQYYFTQGSSYKQKYGNQIMFKDTSGTKASLDTNHFVHYNDGSLGSFTKGVIMDISDLSTEETYGYYSLTKNTILVKNGNSYEMTSRGESMALSEFVWKISDNDYMLVSPTITLDVGPEEVTFQDYAQITYVDSGIVRISHQTGSYQTVAADSELVTEQGAELNLVGKSFMVDGEPIFSLDDMAIDDDSYIDVDENVPDVPTIPTFNVINGKDGASGSDGEQGVEGDQGEDGEDGEEGEEGAEGTAGGEGTMGSEGALGEDGVEGKIGVQGYDGAEGTAGEDAETAKSASSTDPVDLYARPEVTMSPIGDDPTSSAFNITSNSATFSLNMKDYNTDADGKPQKAFVSNSTTVTLINNKTLEKKVIDINDVENGSWITQLENGSSTIEFEGLDSNTEYTLVVGGKYYSDPKSVTDPAAAIETTYFRKTFTTEGAGISIEKNYVKEDEISANVIVSSDNINKYYVRFYYYKDGIKTNVVEIDNGSGSAENPLVKNTYPETVNNDTTLRPAGFTTELLQSNTTYYAELFDVNGGKIKTDGSEIELKTLKKTPYDKANTDIKMTEMRPTLEPNNNNHSLILKLGDVVDEDNGVRKYRYELYDKDKLYDSEGNPISDLNMSEITPSFVQETDSLSNVTFKLPTTDTTSYVGRVVAVFDDNEKTRDLSTMLTGPVSLSETSDRLVVEFKDITNPESDINMIEGNIYINDIDNVVLPNIDDGDQKLILTLTSDYNDQLTYTFTKAQVEAALAAASSTTTATLPFTFTGLRANANYSLTLVGPQNTSGADTLSALEKKTYLAGIRTTTPAPATQSLAKGIAAHADLSYYRAPEEKNVPKFAARILLSAAAVEDEPAVQNQLKSETYIIFRLVTEDGQRVGEDYTYIDAKGPSYLSDLKDAFVQRASVSTNSDGSLSIVEGASVSDKEIILTPYNFQAQDDARISAGGNFRIIAIEAGDYKGTKDGVINRTDSNKFLFKDGEDFISFSVKASHNKVEKPNDEVEVYDILNGDYKEESLDASTVIGLRFKAKYLNADADKIIYKIYRIKDGVSDTSATIDNSVIYSANDPIKEGDGAGLEWVLSGESDLGNTHDFKPNMVELYFNETECATPGYEWTKSNTGVSAAGETILKRGERYIIAYEVIVNDTMHKTMTCKTSENIYPACVYQGEAKVPMYRSKVIEIASQVPKVERYPYTSTSGSEIWMYRFNDPDNALVTTKSGDDKILTVKVATNASFENIDCKYDEDGNYIAGTGIAPGAGSKTSAFTNISSDFKQYEITGLTQGQYYRVDIPYKKIRSGEVEYVGSSCTKFMPTGSPNVSNQTSIRLEGKKATSKDTDTIDVGGVKYCKAIVSEGNYRYRVTVQGTDVDKLAGLRITLKYTESGTAKSLVYDPVFFIERGDTDAGDPYAIATFEASPLKNLPNSTTITAEIRGYYAATNGFGDAAQYVAQSSYPNDSFVDTTSGTETIFPIYSLFYYGNDGSVNYKKIEITDEVRGTTKLSDTYKGLLNSSLFVPNGFNVAGATLNQKYPINPLLVTTSGGQEQSSGFVDNNYSNIKYDATGVAISGGTYVNVQKLEVTAPIAYKNGDNSFVINGVMPAIELTGTIAPGSVTASMRMQLFGSIANKDSKVYAMVYKRDKTSNTIKYVEAKINNVDIGDGKHIQYLDITQEGTGAAKQDVIYDVNDTNRSNLYGKTTYQGNNLEVEEQYGKYYVNLRLRNLDPANYYIVNYFTYDGENIRFLLSKTLNEVGADYSFTTSDQIKLQGRVDHIEYNSYTDKKVYFDYLIAGGDGSYTVMSYELWDSTTGDKVVNPIWTHPVGEGSAYWTYYGNWNENEKFYIDMKPVDGPIDVNTKYEMKLKIYDNGTGSGFDPNNPPETPRGTNVDKIEFTPALLREPVVDIRDIYYSSDKKVRVVVSSTDANRAIYMDSYDVVLLKPDGSEMRITKTRPTGLYSTIEQTVEFDVSEYDYSSYKAYVEYKVDVQNKGESAAVAMETVQKSVSANARASADIEYDYDLSSLTLSLSNTKNFENVDNVYVTVLRNADPTIPGDVDTIVFYESKTLDDSMSVTYDWSSKVQSGRKYTIQIQYRNSSGGEEGAPDSNFKVNFSN